LVKNMARMCEKMGEEEKAQEYAARAKRIREMKR